MDGTKGWSLVVLVLLAMPLQAAEIAGQVGYMSGSLMAKGVDGAVKVLAPKSQVMEGDVLATSKNGYAQVVLNDGTQLTMRPESNLKIEAYRFRKEAPQADNAVFRLLKGGVRSLTGLISKRGNPDAYKLHAAAATIGIRGTDFSARLCEADECRNEVSQRAKAVPRIRLAVGRVMLLQGAMSAKDKAGDVRKLLLGAPVYEGETLITESQSQAVVAFRDESRVTLQAASTFVIEQFKYDRSAGQENAALRLLKGTVRVVTGLIGRADHDNFRFGVAGATIGVRGTGFDAWCNGPCASGSANPGATLDNPQDGAGVYVWAGAVVLVSPQGSVEVALQQAAIISRDSGRPVPLLVIPRSILENNAPRPDSVPVDVHKEFDAETGSGAAGVYVTVHDGQVILSQNNASLSLGSGENGYANGGQLLRLLTTPQFMNPDVGALGRITPGQSVNQVGCVVR